MRDARGAAGGMDRGPGPAWKPGPFRPGGRGRMPWLGGNDAPGAGGRWGRLRRANVETDAEGNPLPVHVELFGRQGCHLCDEARGVVERVVAEEGAVLVEHDIDADEALRAKYSEYVPVVVVDGRQHATWRVDARLLARAIRAARRANGRR